ncbi:hypothetical protein ATANTOWER_009997 [Ataeniobius toweri]|uniref:Secreted protein n=1 Tax=Ataeniobius toweri TaxID=208326 RepID=A0ABU7BQE7_9TELE|nr:hypothetical protein [Ataeniobius toweri]
MTSILLLMTVRKPHLISSVLCTHSHLAWPTPLYIAAPSVCSCITEIYYIAKCIGSHHQINEFWCFDHFLGCRCIKFCVEKLDCPAQSPYLRLLEHLWDE